MIRIRTGKIIKILEERADIQVVVIDLEGKPAKGINYPLLTGKVNGGDMVQVNTTAVDLGLGTGGYHFIMANLQNKGEEYSLKPGHIMKMRYAPHQVKVLAVEEKESPYHKEIKNFTSLQNTPVLIGFLHSMLLPALAGIRAVNDKLKVSYIMTDGGALPLAFSKTVQKARELNWLKGTITVGHAFGGDLEAVNIYSGLAAGKAVHKADLLVIIMGPGIVGTGTKWGTTALEVGQIVNAVASLEGRPIVIPRISFQDKRERHQGLSHHVLTVLQKIALAPSTVVFPLLDNEEALNYLKGQISEYNLTQKHKIVFEDGRPGLNYLQDHNLEVTTMGRSLGEEKEFFLAASAAGSFAAKLMQ